MLFSAKKTEEKLILIIEIQSSIVRCSAIWYRPGAPARIVLTDEQPVPFKQNVGTEYFVKVTMRALKEATDSGLRRLHLLARDGKHSGMPHHASEAHYVLSSPWIASQAKVLSLAFDKNTVITREKISEILAKERAALAPADGGPLETIEEKIFDVRLNGYSVEHWEGKQARELEVSYAATVGGTDTIKRLSDAVSHIVAEKRIFFHSSLLLQYIGLRSAMPGREFYNLIHIHGELTDVLVVKGGTCVFFGSYPLGVNTVVRKIAHSTRTDMQTADSLLSLHLGGKLDPAQSKNVSELMKDMASGWSGEFAKLFKDGMSGLIQRDTIIAARAHEELFIESFRAAYPDMRAQAWSSEEMAPLAAFDQIAPQFRVIGAYAIALYDMM